MYDVAIVGAGAAGIAAAKSALKYRLKAVLIEEDEGAFGGVCLNRGCIPTKFFINSAKLNRPWPEIRRESQKIVQQIKKPLLSFLTTQGVDVIWGKAEFAGTTYLVAGGKKIEAKNIIVACGSAPRELVKDSRVILAEKIFSLSRIPERILVLGAGYIGIEIASLLNNFGKKVAVIEKENNILPGFDSYLAKRLRVILERKGIRIETAKSAADYAPGNFDMIVSALGRKPATKDLNIKKASLALTREGWIKTDGFLRTNVKNVYACGDVTGKKLLAYVAEYQGRLCIENIAGNPAAEDYAGLAECVFSLPAAAMAGQLEEEAERAGINCKVIKTNFLKFSSSHLYRDTEGFIKVAINEKEEIIGAGVISQAAGDLINILSLCIRNKLKLPALKKCLFVHPTLSEILPLLFLDN